jgi:glycosyltransferase involved in cell wall biosynthesis
MKGRQIRSIAMIDTDGGDGIGGYTYELAEGLEANGVAVDVYSNSRAPVLALPRRHRVLPVLGGALFKRGAQGAGKPRRVTEPCGAGIEQRGQEARGLKSAIRQLILPFELALHLKRARYDLVWVQWPGDVYHRAFYSWCRRLGLPVVHTVHNLLPHEEQPDDATAFSGLYHAADALVVHSYSARDQLTSRFPTVSSKTIVSRIGLYTMFPRDRTDRSATRQQLGIAEGQPLLLFFGGVRPYKNIDAVLGALGEPALRDAWLVVAGREAGYPEQVTGDPLGRTRRRASELGVADRTRLLPGRLSLTETSALFQAADILVLPYVKSYGSASLLLGISFGKHIVATKTGGMDEYLTAYPRHTLLAGCDVGSVSDGLIRALAQPANPCRDDAHAMAEFEWPTIANRVLDELTRVLSSLQRLPFGTDAPAEEWQPRPTAQRPSASPPEGRANPIRMEH